MSEVYNITSQFDVHHVPVLDSKQLVGIVSFTDMMQSDFKLRGFDQRGFADMIDQQIKTTDIMSQSLIIL